ncbi:MAG TPA: hypothetical protein VLY63_26975, partial [Anaerolineae bacterium]|nr:hypothetical protein [Anaerolineae bacterium]
MVLARLAPPPGYVLIHLKERAKPLETGILTTKLYRPRISGDLVPRPRLLERLIGPLWRPRWTSQQEP